MTLKQIMRPIKQFVAGLLATITGNFVAQMLLQRLSFYVNYLMGVGAGAQTSSSGESKVLQNLLHRGGLYPVIFDVGANQGQFLSLVLDKVNALDSQIHCFEPSKDAFAALAVAFRERPNVHLNNIALAAEPGEANLYFDQFGSGLASLTRRRLDHFGLAHDRHEIVTLDTVDDYCDAHEIDEITLLKIDVEGHELDVLRGAAGMIGKKAVAAVTFEFGGCNIDTRTFFQDYWYFFEGSNMSLYRVTPSGYLHPIKAYSEALEQMVTTNFVAIR